MTNRNIYLLSEKKLVYFISFFSYSGYYAGLMLIFAAGLESVSRFYSVPLRLLMMVLSLLLIYKNIENLIKKVELRFVIILFLSFWVFYFYKVLLSASDLNLRISWYEYIFYSISFSILPFITFSLISYKKYYQVIIDALILSGFFFALFATYFYWSLFSGGIGRIGTQDMDIAAMNPLSLAYSAVVTIVFCLYRIISNNNSFMKRVFYILTIIISSAIFFLGASRGATISLLLSVSLLMFLSHGKNKIYAIFFVFLMLIVLIISAMYSDSSILRRITALPQLLGNVPEEGSRFYIWNLSLNEFIENPILGGRIELGGYNAHNFVIEILMSTGLLGSFLILPIIFLPLIFGWINTVHDDAYVFVYILYVQGLVHYSFSGSIMGAIMLFLPLGMLYAQNKRG